MPPLLSICIPTYNRACSLEKSLESITSQKGFLETDEVEIVISDNCSTDHTREITARFAARHGAKIRYHRNDCNIHDLNFEKALSLGQGDFLKLQNDTVCLYPGALEEMLQIVRSTLKEKNVLFFLNGHTGDKRRVTSCNGADQLVSHISYYSTWIGGFGIWREDFNRFNDFNRKAGLQLVQTDVLFRMLQARPDARVLNSRIFKIQEVSRGGYNAAEVFGKNYLEILKENMAAGYLSPAVYSREKKRMLLKHVIPLYFDFERQYGFRKGSFWQFTRDYHRDYYFYTAFLGIMLKNRLFMVTKIRMKIFLYRFVFKNGEKLDKYQLKLKDFCKNS